MDKTTTYRHPQTLAERALRVVCDETRFTLCEYFPCGVQDFPNVYKLRDQKHVSHRFAEREAEILSLGYERVGD